MPLTPAGGGVKLDSMRARADGRAVDLCGESGGRHATPRADRLVAGGPHPDLAASTPLMGPSELLALQRMAGNGAVDQLLTSGGLPVQRTDGDDEEQDPSERSRQSRPRNAPQGTVPIDQSGLDRETIHKIKDGIGAGPKDWVGISPEGHVITSDGDGNAEDHGHMGDYCSNGAELIPKWVWGLLAIGAAIGIIVLFATGVGEVATILAGAGALVVLAVKAALRAAGKGDSGTASNDTEVAPGDDDQSTTAAA